MKSHILLFLLISFGIIGKANATSVSIPDQTFENKLISMGVDDVLDGQVSLNSIDTVTSLNLNNISSLQGLEHFTSLVHLYLYSIDISQVILPALNSLKKLRVSYSGVMSQIDVSNLMNITYLSIHGINLLTELDVSMLSNLDTLSCYYNSSLSNLYLPSSTHTLKRLYCAGNSLTSIDASSYSNLQYMNFSANSLISLILPSSSSLKVLSCANNNLTNLDLSLAVNLEELSCSNNLLTSLNVSTLTNLKALFCSNNSLTSLDLSNLGKLDRLYCNSNSLTSLNVTSLSNLWNFSCGSNSLESLDLSGNPKLFYLNCSHNLIKQIKLSINNTNLRYLYCNDNLLGSLDISMLPSLGNLYTLNNESLKCLKVSSQQSEDSDICEYKPDFTSLSTVGCSVYTIKDGDWFDPNVWNTGVVPAVNDSVRVLGDIIQLDAPNAKCNDLHVEAIGKTNQPSIGMGELIIDASGSLNVSSTMEVYDPRLGDLTENKVVIKHGGELTVE